MAKRKTTSTVRLNKFIADCGLASRRRADKWIEDGKVILNGKTVYELGIQIDPNNDLVKIGGKAVKPKPTHFVYIAFHKPTHVMTTLSDPEGRTTVKDFFPKIKHRIFPVGRLDWDTEGLLLLTNDGDFSQSVSHPSQEIPKTYLVKLDGKPTDAQLQKLRNGVSIVGGKVKALHIERVKKGSDKYDWVRIAVAEGKNRQVRRMFEKIGFDVKRLKRISIGALPLGQIPKGAHAYITASGLAQIFEIPKWMRDPKPKGPTNSKFQKKKKKKTVRKKKSRTIKKSP